MVRINTNIYFKNVTITYETRIKVLSKEHINLNKSVALSVENAHKRIKNISSYEDALSVAYEYKEWLYLKEIKYSVLYYCKY